jgi:putative flavoprotein involved in K+ transport
VTGRDGGRDIDLRKLATEGLHLYGRLKDLTRTRLQFADDLKLNLDQADAVAESIKNTIDKFIESAGIDALAEARYRPVWEPTHQVLELDYIAANITTVIWSIGYRTDYSWIEVPVFDGKGYPAHQRGVTTVPGLYFLGLPWQYTWGSGRFSGVARDATFLADYLEARRGAPLQEPARLLNELALGS